MLRPSLGSARIFGQKPRLVQFFQKARVEKMAKNEPIIGFFSVNMQQIKKKLPVLKSAQNAQNVVEHLKR